ncbi:MAG: glutamate--cysteine ligase [Actinomycetota bacterium]|nr:glutamate--cysteine ligase [Actinomycetota bacterium]
MDSLTLGVEEEFLVVDAATGDLVPRSHVVLPYARRALGEAVTSELNLCQIEFDTPVCTTLKEVRYELTRLRSGLRAAAGAAGCGVAAVGTHPFGVWQDQGVDVSRERYRQMEEVYQIVARQQVICGCHVHVGFPDPELAIATMNRARPWLPILLALAANSPFWQAVDSGYASYRLQVWQRWPTLGMPPHLGSMKEFKGLIEELKSIEAIEDPTFIYWYVRPSVRFPTLEFRACDVCASVDDAVVLAGLIRALAWSCAQDVLNARPQEKRRRELLEAAMWRAARYGLEGTLVSPSAMVPRPAVETVAELLTYLRAGLEAHGDWLEVSEGVSEILRRGNGASRQRRVFARRQNLHDVIVWALSATFPGNDD